ncbi:GNAT family N-acetyltransferase [Kitasatospora purpeofusca]|uniref:GNAT family N-acetyltransferase n=1 Tax=Kitasatospora purpeofusca TaxID=67352 RepID=UPI002A5AD701|nr:GNAT family N-acetyltransferase [Kitasatospora purpeofusca]MDY0813640.1 GNAT family N-acetyltransferase [Kitasatospora purpeofusca]
MLTLRELTGHDTDAVRRVYTGRAVADLWFGQMTSAQARDYVREAADSSRRHPRTLHVLGIDLDGDLLGIVRLRSTGSTGHLAYILREDAWGHGYATAAVRLLLTGTTVRRITAEHRVGNPASGRVLTKAGFVRTSTTAELVRYEIIPSEPAATKWNGSVRASVAVVGGH